MAHGHLAKLSFFLPKTMWSNPTCLLRAAPNLCYSPKHAKALSWEMLFGTSLICAKDGIITKHCGHLLCGTQAPALVLFLLPGQA